LRDLRQAGCLLSSRSSKSGEDHVFSQGRGQISTREISLELSSLLGTSGSMLEKKKNTSEGAKVRRGFATGERFS